MRRCAIIGGETHIGEVTALRDKRLELVVVAVRPDQNKWAQETFGDEVPVVSDDVRSAIKRFSPDIVAIANENDLRAGAIIDSLESGCDVIADKPLTITVDDHERIVSALSRNPERKVLNLLTLRGTPQWRGVDTIVKSGAIGVPAHCNIRMAVRLKRSLRPPWFLDVNRSGGLFLDLLIHGLDVVEWIIGSPIVALTASTGNLGFPDELSLRDHASVYCELASGATATVEGQRMLPDTKGSDYRISIAGTKGYVDMDHVSKRILVTNDDDSEREVDTLPEAESVVDDWLDDGTVVPQTASLRANYLALMATHSAERRERVNIG